MMTATITCAKVCTKIHIREAATLDTETARMIVAMMRREVVFRIGAGARCPLCGAYAGTRSGAANGVRYHVCPECDHRFSSIFKRSQ